MANMNQLFAPKMHAVRKTLDLGRRHGQIINPPRMSELGGMTTKNADQRESELALRKPGSEKKG